MSDPLKHHGEFPRGRAAMGAKDFFRRETFPDFEKENIEESIPEHFEKIVRLYPDRLAIKMGERSLTYDQLNRYANRIARAIVEKRGPGSEPIALFFEHGIDIIAAILGVLKAGKFYVAIDPSFPNTRVNLIVEDSQAKLIVTNKPNYMHARHFTDVSGALLNIDQIDSSGDDNLETSIGPESIASIMYTSGSTGTPRGVVDTHSNVLESSRYLAEMIHLVVDDRLSLLHKFTYASARTSAFMSLLNGASLFPFDFQMGDAEHLAVWVNSEGLTILYCPIAFFRQFANLSIEAIPLPSLRILHLSGAPITQSDFELYTKRFHDGVGLEISMGSTEARGIGIAVLNKQFSFPIEGTPVGYAPPGKEVLILDENHRALSTGEVGQIAVRGKNLSPGYWKQPNITTAKFLPDPDGGDERIYLTGDLGKMLPDGFLVHMGRKDLMVKIRGYRVDISEVERALLEHPGVKEAGVASWDREPGEKYLAGYIVPRRESGLDVSEVREFLSKKLPDYMVPSTFMFMESLPLTNGKLDRSALPKPDHRRPELKEPYVAPRNDIETKLSRIWGEALVVDQVGIRDNFFDLGGHSLAGAAIIARIKEEFGIELPISRLLDSPTVAEMAECIDRRQNGGTGSQTSRAEGTGDSTLVAGAPGGKSPIGFPKEEVEQSIPERFEKVVREYPCHPAVEADNEVLTYAEINAQSNLIARAILKRAERNVYPVALLFEKGSAQIIAMLAVLKAGKFFVLLDPSLPEERLAAILEDTGSELLIHDQKNTALATKVAFGSCQLLQPSLAGGDGSTENLGRRIAPKDLAYVVYTSGSTGTPKGVIQNHQNILHRTMLRVRRDHLHPNDRFAHISSGTSNEITNAFYTLLTGASMVVFDLRKEGVDRLAEWLVRERITLCSFATPLFRKLCETLTGTERFPHLRSIGFRSDAIYKSDVELFERFFPPHCVLVTALSSTETGALTETVIPKASEILGNEVPIGRPQPDKEILLLDDDGHQVKSNQIGEIVVRSKYLSPGYWRRPDLTAAKFKVDPHDPNQRFYYTGDLGLMLPDGCLVHKGRKDFRVKIRGYGVEIAEVEKTLRGHNGVTDCVVIDQKDESGETKLTAFYSSAGQLKPNASELRKFLSGSLPGYMVPSTFVRLETIPLMPNGKVDRKALPEPGTDRPELTVSYEAPRNPVERRLAEFWAEVLSLDRVGVHDNFFDLGGHSLSGARLVSLIHEEFHIDLPVSEFFAEPTIAQLAQRIEAAGKARPAAGKKSWTYLCELQRGNHNKPVFFFPGGGGGEPEFFVYGFLARHVGTEYPVYGLRARGADGVLQPHATVTQMADAYVEEIRAMQPEGPYFLVGECAGGVTAYEAARQLLSQGQEVAMLVLMDVERPTLIKYLAFRKSRWLEPVRQFCDDTVCKWWRENYYLARLPHHLRQLRSLALREYPSYVTGRIAHTLKPPEKKPRLIDSRRERAEIVLYATASGDALRHIEWVRESYRRAVRRFHPQPYNGPIEIIVSEKLYRRDPTLGWKELAPKGLRIHPVPGNHWSYIRDHVDVVGLELRECLERAERHAAS